jgi:hypothetical protein
METPMTKAGILSIGFIAAATLMTPAMAQEAIQEPGVLGFYYPNSHYLTGGYGVRATPGPRYYYRNEAYGYAPDYYPRVGYGYAYRQDYGRYQYRPYPPVGAFATAPWTDGSGYGAYAYDGEPETVWVAP